MTCQSKHQVLKCSNPGYDGLGRAKVVGQLHEDDAIDAEVGGLEEEKEHTAHGHQPAVTPVTTRPVSPPHPALSPRPSAHMESPLPGGLTRQGQGAGGY